MLIAGLGRAAAIAEAEAAATAAHMTTMRERLRAALEARLPAGSVRVHGPSQSTERLPNTLSVALYGTRASELLARLRGQVSAPSRLPPSLAARVRRG